VQSKADMSRLIYSAEPTTKKWRTEKLKRKKTDIYSISKYQKIVRGIRGVSPEEEKEGYGWKDLQKRKVLRP